MSQTDTRQILLGALLLLAGSALIFGIGTGIVGELPALTASIAAIGLAAGTLLLGTSDPGRPV